MPYKTGQDIGGFGRLMEAQRWVKEQERADVKQEQQTRLFNLQMEANQQNVNEVKRKKSFESTYAQIAMKARDTDNWYNNLQDGLSEWSQSNPGNEDLVLNASRQVDEIQSEQLDKLFDINPELSTRLANETLLKRQGISAKYAGKVGDEKLVEMWDQDPNNDIEDGTFLGTFYKNKLDPETKKPLLYSKNSISKPEPKDDEVDLTPEGVDYAAKLLNVTGRMLPLGRGKKATKIRKQIIERAEQLAKGDVASTIVTQADVASLRKSIDQQQKQYGSMGSFVKNLNAQIERVGAIIPKLKSADARILNVPWRKLRQKIVGNPELAKYEMYLTEIESEIGKLATGSTASVAELSQGAQEKWAAIHDKNLSLPDMWKVLQETGHAGDLRLKSVGDNLRETQERLRIAAGGEPKVEDRVVVVSPTGQEGTIPKEQLQAALAEGYKVKE